MSRPNAKLTEENVCQARDLYREGRSIRQLSRDFGVSTNTMHAAITGRFWSHINNPPPVQKGLRTCYEHKQKTIGKIRCDHPSLELFPSDGGPIVCRRCGWRGLADAVVPVLE